MLNILEEKIKLLPEIIKDLSKWDSLIINRRKPHTYRAFYQFDDGIRMCLHRFETCDEHEAFYHPHPWPGAFKIVKGSYKMQIGQSYNSCSKPVDVATFIMNQGSSYEITSPLTWHTVIPLSECYTIMINGKPFEHPHVDVRTTKGKDLQSMSETELREHLNNFI